MSGKKQLANRYGLFMNDASYDLEIMYGRNYLKSDIVNDVKIHRINILDTKAHKLYGQAKASDRSYFPPIQIKASVTIEDNQQSNYGDDIGGITREDTGNLILGIYLKELEEKKLEITRGDIIEYNLSGQQTRYYEVENAHNVSDTTSQTIAGFKNYWKRVVSIPVKEDIVAFLKSDENK